MTRFSVKELTCWNEYIIQRTQLNCKSKIDRISRCKRDIMSNTPKTADFFVHRNQKLTVKNVQNRQNKRKTKRFLNIRLLEA